MPKFQFTKALRRLTAAFSADALKAIGIEGGFLVRERAITPMNLVPSLIATFGSGRVQSLADLRRRFNEDTGLSVAEKSYYGRLDDPGFVPMMRRVFDHLSGSLITTALSFLPGSPFARFKRVLAQDGTSFALRDALREVFPGRFTKISPAAVEIHTTMDLMTEAPVSTTITADSASERAQLPDPASLADCLLLADRGYPSWEYLAKVRDSGGSFIMRIRKDPNPLVTDRYEGRVRVPLPEPVPLHDFLAENPTADILDLEIRPKGEYGAFRLVVLKTPKGRTLLVNDLPATEFPPDVIGYAYRLRWQVELMYKEWKSYANLHKFSTERAGIAEGLIWAAICAAMVKRFLAHAAQLVGKVAVSTRKAAMMLNQSLPALLVAVAAGAEEQTVERLNRALQALIRDGKRSNPKRERRTGRQRLGLRPAF